MEHNYSRVDESSGEWRCLLALSGLGIDIMKVIGHYQTRTIADRRKKEATKRPSRPRFSEAQRQAVLDGLNHFGYGSWIEMSERYDALKGLSRAVIFDIYKRLKRNDEIPDEVDDPGL